MSAKDNFESDLDFFFNDDEFCGEHTLDGQVINCIVDNEALQARSKKEFDGLSLGEVLLFIKKSELIKTYEQEMPVVFDNKQMYVFKISEDMGVYEIVLSENVG